MLITACREWSSPIVGKLLRVVGVKNGCERATHLVQESIPKRTVDEALPHERVTLAIDNTNTLISIHCEAMLRAVD